MGKRPPSRSTAAALQKIGRHQVEGSAQERERSRRERVQLAPQGLHRQVRPEAFVKDAMLFPSQYLAGRDDLRNRVALSHHHTSKWKIAKLCMRSRYCAGACGSVSTE